MNIEELEKIISGYRINIAFKNLLLFLTFENNTGNSDLNRIDL